MNIFILLFVLTVQAHAWGNKGHELIAEEGSHFISPKAFENCHVTLDQLVEHSTDPDLKWRRDRRRHPDEEQAHFMHLDRQPEDWRSRKTAKDPSQGYLVYRILNWMEKAKALKKAQKWGELSETLYGLVHYIADLTMPLHLTSQHDGKEVGLPDLHKQWETKLVGRYEKELRSMVKQKLAKEALPVVWRKIDYNELIMNIAQQSFEKVPTLFVKAKNALIYPRLSSRSKKRSTRENVIPRFSKPLLFDYTGTMVADQLALAARLWVYTFSLICL